MKIYNSLVISVYFLIEIFDDALFMRQNDALLWQNHEKTPRYLKTARGNGKNYLL
jgi:hypothetical protein